MVSVDLRCLWNQQVGTYFMDVFKPCKSHGKKTDSGKQIAFSSLGEKNVPSNMLKITVVILIPAQITVVLHHIHWSLRMLLLWYQGLQMYRSAYTLCWADWNQTPSYKHKSDFCKVQWVYMCYLAPPEDVRHTCLGNADPQVTVRLQHICQDTISNISCTTCCPPPLKESYVW